MIQSVASRTACATRLGLAIRAPVAARRSTRAFAESPADKPAEPAGEKVEVDQKQKEAEGKADWQETFSASQIFGSYVQLGVWVFVLSLAGFTGFQKAQTNPEQVGMLLAPPVAAVALIIIFVIYRLANRDKYEY